MIKIDSIADLHQPSFPNDSTAPVFKTELPPSMAHLTSPSVQLYNKGPTITSLTGADITLGSEEANMALGRNVVFDGDQGEMSPYLGQAYG